MYAAETTTVNSKKEDKLKIFGRKIIIKIMRAKEVSEDKLKQFGLRNQRYAGRECV